MLWQGGVFSTKNVLLLFRGFLQWWYPTTMGFPTKNDHFGVFWGYPYFWKHPFCADNIMQWWTTEISQNNGKHGSCFLQELLFEDTSKEYLLTKKNPHLMTLAENQTM